jgi:hypothetical protein
MNNIYSFEIYGFSEKINRNTDSKIKVINLKDSYNCEYDVIALPNQENKLIIGNSIECKIEKITFKLHLRQVNIDDPFFYSFENRLPCFFGIVPIF